MSEQEAQGKDLLRDRHALEQIVGHALSDSPWPELALRPGTRVQVLRDPDWAGPWARDFYGVVDTTAAPTPIEDPRGRPGEFAYFVLFDEPELDSSGDGPYRKAQIWGRYLRPISLS